MTSHHETIETHEPSRTHRDEALARCRLLRSRGEHEEAIAILYELFGTDLTDVEVVTDLASLLAESGRFDPAMRLFRHGIRLGGSNQRLRMNYGAFLGHAGDLEGARDLLEELVVELEAELAERRSLRARAMVDESRYKLGVVQDNLARTYLGLEKAEKARALVESRLTCRVTWEGAEDVYGEYIAYMGQDHHAAAIELLEEGRASAGMVAYLADHALFEDLDPVGGVEVLLQGAAYLPRSVLRASEDLQELVKDLTLALRRAIMRGEDPVSARRALESLGSLTRRFGPVRRSKR